MFEFTPSGEIFPWNKGNEEDQDDEDTGLPNGD